MLAQHPGCTLSHVGQGHGGQPCTSCAGPWLDGMTTQRTALADQPGHRYLAGYSNVDGVNVLSVMVPNSRNCQPRMYFSN